MPKNKIMASSLNNLSHGGSPIYFKSALMHKPFALFYTCSNVEFVTTLTRIIWFITVKQKDLCCS